MPSVIQADSARIEDLEREVETLRAENARLQDLEAFLRQSQAMANIGSYSWDFASGAVRWSDQMFEIMGVDPADFEGTVEDAARKFHPDDVEAVQHGVQKTLEGDPQPSEYRVLMDDGTVKTVWGQGDVLTDEQGQPYRMDGCVMDVTARRKAEDDLEEARARLQLALDSADMGIWSWDCTTGLVTWSSGTFRIYGVDPGAAPSGLDAAIESVHPEDRDGIHETLRAILTGNDGDDFESEHRTDQPDPRWVLAKGRVFRDDDGRPLRMAGIVLDITERKKLEAQLLHSQRLDSIGRLAGGIAHDFNNLLTVMLGAASMGQMNPELDEEARGHFGTILSSAQHAARLTSQLLAFARRQFVEPRILDPNALVAEIDQLLHRVLGEDIQLHVELSSGIGTVRADRGQLEQVLINLAVNAREAMPQGGQLWIRTASIRRDDRDFVRISVQDDGPGMDADTARQAFEPFFSTKPHGNGLGLASCYGIVCQASGYLEVDSVLREGTTFRVDIPRTEGATSATATSTDALDPHGHETVLVAEDEPEVRRLIADTLLGYGYRVLEAEDGEQAMQVAADYGTGIDLLVTDAVMPSMGGARLAAAMRTAQPGIQVLMVSGFVDSLPDPEAGVSFLQKPFAPRALAERVRALLDTPA